MAHAAKWSLLVLDRPSRSRVSFTRIEVLSYGEKFRKGSAKHDGDDMFGSSQALPNGPDPGPEESPDPLGVVAERTCTRPWVMNPSWMWRW